MRILVRRHGALGDVVLTTPIIRRLRRENPGAEIGIQTGFPDVFRNSPRQVTVLAPGPLPYPWTEEGGVDRVVELGLAYERRPYVHIVQAYMQEVFGDDGEPLDLQQELFFATPAAWPTAKPIIAVHATKAGWRNRTLPEATWRGVVAGLKRAGYQPLLIGSGRDILPNSGAPAFHTADLMGQAGIISRAACFVGSDSGLLHVAGATQTPIVGVFTCALPEMRMPWRQGGLGWHTEAVLPDLDCVGCLARCPAPATTETCERGDVACVRDVTAEAIVAAVVRRVILSGAVRCQ